MIWLGYFVIKVLIYNLCSQFNNFDQKLQSLFRFFEGLSDRIQPFRPFLSFQVRNWLWLFPYIFPFLLFQPIFSNPAFPFETLTYLLLMFKGNLNSSWIYSRLNTKCFGRFTSWIHKWLRTRSIICDSIPYWSHLLGNQLIVDFLGGCQRLVEDSAQGFKYLLNSALEN